MHPSLTSTLLRDNAIHAGDTTTSKFKAFVRQLGLHQKGIKQQRSTLLRSQTCRPRHNHNQVEGFH
ncbi:hypothetical protein HanRHA438_Chr17g0799201 [Helianthus annuus]|uniref:Uncharacterized protein n=1 Tax=Helianthus annuus TaxID=4232 RepID=A0A9K3GSG3_HELAN|nr:hypothetical protein HanXRQr2_Chr17g0788701 [Helianthus annuus]KAJ0428165.1 hypothetical protein HanHA300_Chr17g0643111 [Helianthus annuus]KAJ0446470.1 hypothetical protein HanHA89_Chr17g0694641 [Helianthus annuus]KAJ0635292.1 hypothetical protein HanOQP8_Chr17g0649241 [Helianthus annuus]KAJ0811980.1 hypothetical protein HanPSC8_Chr17g0756781 [Helianthus annuus]